jgi:adenosyl cobinamide kinase/adenosyl cobinamide phosphate guanylyltransferase
MPTPRFTGITIVDGPLGSGKSYYAVRLLEEALWRGRPVSTNVELVEDWADIIARHRILVGPNREQRRQAHAQRMRSLYYYSDDVVDVLYADIEWPDGRAIKENDGLMVIDEAHSVLNNRLFAEEGRKELVDRIRQLRKRGWECDVITQHVESVDKHVRDAGTYRVELVNWKRRYWWFPFNLFLALRFFAGDKTAGKGRKPMERSLYRMDVYIASLYNTMGLFGYERTPNTARRRVTLPLAPLAPAQLASRGEGA